MADRVSSIHLSWRVREEGAGDPRQTRREYLDFVIDGESLGQLTGLGDPGYIGFLGWMPDDDAYERGLLKQLLLEEPSELETGRRLLYMCPECGDVGCGALTAVVRREDDNFIWAEFGVERDWRVENLPFVDLAGFEEVGPYRFEVSQYRDALLNWPSRPPEMKG
jgi:hypothetical protein